MNEEYEQQPPLEERIQRLEDLVGKLFETACDQQHVNLGKAALKERQMHQYDDCDAGVV